MRGFDFEELLGGFAGYFALFLVVAGIAWLIRKASSARDVRALPEAHERMEVLRELRRLRGGGASHQKCLSYLRDRGYRAGVARGLLIDVEREQPADVKNPRPGAWGACSFQFPGNWKITPLFESAGPEYGISIEGFGSAMLLLVPALEEGAYAEMLREQSRQIRDPEQTALARWGRFRGEGVRFSGAHAKMKLLTEIEVFRPHGVDPPFLLVQYHAVEEADLVAPGFRLIQETLTAAS